MLTEAPQMAVKDAVFVILTGNIASPANFNYAAKVSRCQLKSAIISP